MPANSNQSNAIESEATRDSDESRVLIEMARAGNSEAVDELLNSLRGYLLLVANQESSQQLRAKVAPSDIVQSVLIRAQQNLADFRGSSRKTLLAWVRKIVRHEVISAERKYLVSEKRNAHRELRLSSEEAMAAALVDEARSPPSDAVIREEAARLRTAVENLPVDYREVIVLRNWQRMPFGEIAQHMSRSEDAVKKLWSRAIRRLEKELQVDAG